MKHNKRRSRSDCAAFLYVFGKSIGIPVIKGHGGDIPVEDPDRLLPDAVCIVMPEYHMILLHGLDHAQPEEVRLIFPLAPEK